MKTTLLIILAYLLPIVAVGQTITEIEKMPSPFGSLPFTRQIKGYCLTGYKELPDIGYFATYERVTRTDTLVTEIFGIPTYKWRFTGNIEDNLYHKRTYTTITGEPFICTDDNFKPFNW